MVVYPVKQIGSPYDLELKTSEVIEEGIQINLPFRLWEVNAKKIADIAILGETITLSENTISASIQPSLEPLTDVKLIFDFCLDAHCFEDIYAKVLSVDKKDGVWVHQLQITSIDPKDRSVLDQWMKEAG